LLQDIRIFSQRTVDNVSEIWLVADMNETKQRKSFIPPIVTVVDKHVLKTLKELHQEEPKDSNRKSSVISPGVDIPG